jgi:hypothetical protein
MKKIIIFVVLISILNSQAQTKLIAHKSHSGTNKTFVKSYQKNLFDSKYSNLGMPGNRNLIILEKVIVKNDSIVILETKESIVCYQYGMGYKELKKSDFKSKEIKLINHKIINKKIV